ncbi:MAG: hypothetical protein QM713_16990 [Arachnia sp.]
MAWFSRPDRTLFDGLDDAVGHRADVLTHGTGDGVLLVATREELALKRGDQWRAWRWEEIGGGSWKAESQRFRWRTVDNQQHEAALTDPSRLPEVFRERVDSSMVVRTVLDLGRGQVQIVARRGLGSDGSLHWYAIPSGGADLADEPTRRAVVAETDRLKAEYA